MFSSIADLRTRLAYRRENLALQKLGAACGLTVEECRSFTNPLPRDLKASLLENSCLVSQVLAAVYGGTPAAKFSLLTRLFEGCLGLSATVIVRSFPGIMRQLGGSATFEQYAAITQEVLRTAPEQRAEVVILFELMLSHIVPEVSPAMLSQFIRAIDYFVISARDDFQILHRRFPELLGSLERPLTPEGIEATRRFLAMYHFKAEADSNREYRVPETLAILGPVITVEQLKSFTSYLAAVPRSYQDLYDTALAKAVENISPDGSVVFPVNGEKLLRLGRCIDGLIHRGQALNAVLADLPILFDQLNGAVSESVIGTIGEILRKRPKHPQIIINTIIGSIEALREEATSVVTLGLVAACFRGEALDPRVSSQLATVAELATLVFGPDQNFTKPKLEFYERLRDWRKRSEPPVLAVNVSSIICRYRALATEYRVIKGKELNTDFLRRLETALYDNARRADAYNSVCQLLGVSNWREIQEAESETDAMVSALRRLTGQRQAHAIKALGCGILALSGLEILVPSTDFTDSFIKRTHDLLTFVCEAYAGHLPDWFGRQSIALSAESQLLISRFVGELKAEINKVRASGENTELEVDLVATKNIFDAFYDAIGENCAGDYGFALLNPRFQPIRLLNRATKEHVGVVYALKGMVEGTPALVLAGVELRKAYAYAIKPIGKFIEELVDRLFEVAIENGLNGGVWTTVGDADASKGLAWTDDGRIGQYDLVREALVNLGLARRGAQAFKILAPEEQIQFPPGFKRRIHRVLRLERQGL